jgi:D-lactate dehydrogenase
MSPADVSAAFYEAFEEEELYLRKNLPSNKRYFFTWKTIQEAHLSDDIPLSEIISIRTQSKIPAHWAKILKGIITRSTGYDHVNEYLLENSAKIASAYLPDYAGRAVAEHAMMLWTCLLRKLPQQIHSFKKFQRDGLTGSEIRNRKIAIVGIGRIGSQIVDIAHGLEMDFCGVDIVPNNDLIKKYGLRYFPLAHAVKISDIIVCALPLTELTRGLMDARVLSSAPRGAIFVNVGRGEISPANDLLELVRDGILSGVGLDVYNYEKELALVLRNGMSLDKITNEAKREILAITNMMSNPAFILTPHNAFNTEESVERKSIKTAENLSSFLNCGQFLTPISST